MPDQTPTRPDAAPPSASARTKSRRVAAVVAWLTLAGWVAVIVSSVALGHREATFADLRTAVTAGTVSDVEVIGGMTEQGRGFSVVELRWREGLVGYSTTVVEARPRRLAPAPAAVDATAVVDAPVSELLGDLDPNLRVTGGGRRGGLEFNMLGWAAPAWTAWAALGALFATVALLTENPHPRRATRWAWFWLIALTAPVGPVAYLLFSGVLSGRRVADPGDGNRLTGGWAFLLAVLVGTGVGALGA